MRWLINYMVSCFCRHDWQFETKYVKGHVHQGDKTYMLCKKCGYNKNHWKFH